MIEDRFLLSSVPEEFRRQYFEYLQDSAHNSETTMDGPAWLKWWTSDNQQKEK
jgi:hypothetical protein